MAVFNERKIDPKVKEIIGLLGAGAILGACLVFPGLPVVLKAAMDVHKETKRRKSFKNWEGFNLWRLRAILKRLRQQKIVKVVEKNGEPIVILTQKGKTKYLKYKLDKMMIKKPATWDGKWRLIIYDISKYKKSAQEAFRRIIKELEFLRLQKSVYLFPYPCENEIEFLRQYYGIGDEVMILKVSGLENQEAYRKYFGL